MVTSYELQVDDETSYSGCQKYCIVARPEFLNTLKLNCNLGEFSGALGDIGTFLPLLTALSISTVRGIPQIAFGEALFFAGLYTFSIGLYFEVPIPVQPMKTIASVALIEGYPREQILAAGMIMAVVLLLLGITKWIKKIHAWIPIALVYGIQLGLGLSLMKKGIELAQVRNENGQLQYLGLDSVFISILMGVMCLYLDEKKQNRIPMALVMFVYGIGVAMYRYNALEKERLTIGPDFSLPMLPNVNDFKSALVGLALPQLPLTILNSVVALERLSKDLFPEKQISIVRIANSVGWGNGLFCVMGMLPMCHGAGGLASQYAFGARTNVSILFLGLLKMMLSLLFGSSLLVLP